MGMLATYYGRWAGFDDEYSPWSLPCSMVIAMQEASELKQPLQLVA